MLVYHRAGTHFGLFKSLGQFGIPVLILSISTWPLYVFNVKLRVFGMVVVPIGVFPSHFTPFSTFEYILRERVIKNEVKETYSILRKRHKKE